MIKHYTDLIVWQRSHQLALRIFALYKKANKTSATYEIWKQALRSAFSIPANIVEGYHSHRGKNFVSKLEISRGETAEIDYWLLVLFEIAEIDKNTYESLAQDYLEILLMLNSLILKSA